MFAERAFVRYHLTHDDVRRPDRFHELHAINGRVDPLAEVDLSPPKSAHVTVVFNEAASQDSDGDVAVVSSSGDEEDIRSQTSVRNMTLDLNQSVKDFKQTLR